MSRLEDLKKAKQYSDVKQYDEKNQLIHKMITDAPAEFYIDSDKDGIVGLTHESTGFKIHVPKQVVTGVKLQNKAAASLAPMTAGFGMPNITGGGQGSYTKLPSLTGSMKSQLTTATKNVGEKAKTATPADSMFPATAEHYRKQQELNGYKAANITTGSISRGLGYSPGLWYNEQDYSPAAQTRYGNIVSGLGLSAAGLASIPVLQYLFPERFKNKSRALSTLAVLGGMAAPWALNLPSTLADVNRLKGISNADWTPARRDATLARSHTLSGIDPAKPYGAPAASTPAVPSAPAFGSPNYVAPHVPDIVEVLGNLNKQQAGGTLTPQEQKDIEQAGTHYSGSTSKASGYIPMDLQIAKTHLADVLSEQLSSGYVDYGQAVGLMQRATAESNKPWVTVQNLAHAAVGAGAGALAGTVAAKGIGLFMNLDPGEQKIIRNTGAALGTLINLGKFGF